METSTLPEGTEAAPEPPAAPGAVPPRSRFWHRLRDPRWSRRLVLAVLALVSGLAFGWGLDHDTIHAYYAAGVFSMAHSWHAFFYGAFDQSGTLTMDKLPGAFWVQALSVRLFGSSIWAMVLPQVVEGVLTVLVMYRLVRRVAGTAAGLAAAALLAATPVVLASVRGNLSDPLSLLLILLAADAVLRAVGTGRLRSLLLAGVWIGLAFQAKMTEAWLPVPALGAGYLIAARGSWKKRAAHAVAAAGVLVAVSLSWMVFVAATPSGQRPYVDGSTDDSVFSQVFVYNGTGRFGEQDVYGLHRMVTPDADQLAYSRQTRRLASQVSSSGSASAWNRLLAGDVGRDVGWLLPGAVVCGAAGLVARRGRGRRDLERAALTMTGLWFVTEAVVLSFAHVLLTYYTAMLAAPAVAVAVVGFAAVWRSELAWRRTVLGGVVGGTALWAAWLQHTGGLVVAGAILVAAALAGAVARRRPARRRVRIAGTVLAAAAVALGPLAACGWLVSHGGGPWDAPYSAAGTAARLDPAVLAELRAHPAYGGTLLGSGSSLANLQSFARRYNRQTSVQQRSIVVFTAAEAATFVAGGTDRVIAVGGYTGLIPTPSLDDLTPLVESGQVAFAVVPGPLDTRYGDPRVQLIVTRCRPVAVSGKKESAAAQVYDCKNVG